MTNTERIKALEERVLTLENKLAPPAPPKHHHTRITYAEPAEAPAQKPLTAEEEAFLKTYGIDGTQRQIKLNIQQQRMNEEEAATARKLITAIKKKRSVNVTWYN